MMSTEEKITELEGRVKERLVAALITAITL
jgi:hypothetical protein